MSRCIIVPNGLVASFFNDELQKSHPKIRFNNVDPIKFSKKDKDIYLPDTNSNIPADDPDQINHWYPNGSWFEIDGLPTQIKGLEPTRRPFRTNYIMDFNSNSFKILPKDDGLILRIEFETDGNEMKGWYQGARIKRRRDSGAADGNIEAPEGSEYPFIEVDLNRFSIDGQNIILNQPREEEIRVGMNFDGNGLLELFEGIIGSRIREAIKSEFIQNWHLFSNELEQEIRDSLNLSVEDLGLDADISQLSFSGDRTHICLDVNHQNPVVDTILSYFTHQLDSSIRNLTLIGTNKINGTGNSLDNYLKGNSSGNLLIGLTGNDTIYGGGGDDMLDGGIGSDVMSGGAGNDYFRVDSQTDVIIEQLNEGIDTVESSLTYTLGDNVEKLTLIGDNSIDGTGSQLNNHIVGNEFSNRLYGKAGDDYLDGYLGDDVLYGGEGDDTIVGTLGKDRLIGEAGNDILDAGLFSNIQGTNLLYPSTAESRYLDGGSDDDKLYGGLGNDTLQGGTGNDAMYGWSGDDVYHVDSIGDQVYELADSGMDTVFAYIDYTLSDHLETLVLQDSIYQGTGNSFNNTIRGNSSQNLLEGLAGDDYLKGYYGDDILKGGDGNDDLNGGYGNDDLTGDSGNDKLAGNDGDDLLTGGLGNDLLLGGVGKDAFIFNSVLEGIDTITDFSQLEKDTIQIVSSGFGGRLAKGPITSSQFVLGTSSVSADSRFIYDQSKGSLSFDSDGTGADPATQIAILSNSADLAYSDIVVR